MAEPVYRKEVGGDGSVRFVEVQIAPGSTPIAAAAVSAASEWVKARSGETSTKVGIIGGAVAGPVIAENAGKAVIAGLAGDYYSAAIYGVPAFLGIASAIAAVVIPEHSKGPTDEEIHAAVARMPRDQLISLLIQPESKTGTDVVSTAARPVPTAYSAAVSG